jgi:hypothetical protein
MEMNAISTQLRATNATWAECFTQVAATALPRLLPRLLLWAVGAIRFRVFEFSLNPVENLLTVHGDVLRGLDANPHLVTLHAQHGDIDILADLQCFTDTPSKYEQADQPCRF